MKRITNWRKATVADLESDGLLREASLIHTLALTMEGGVSKLIEGSDKEKLKSFFQWHIDKEIPIVFHNGICFDIPLCEKLLGVDLSNLMVIDTLALSWYLNVHRRVHGLDSFHKDYGIRKPSVGGGEWTSPARMLCHTDEQHKVEEMRHEALMEYRATYDVRINVALWEDLSSRLEEMYTLSKEVIDSGEVGGKRTGDDERVYLDCMRDSLSVDQWVDEILTFLMLKMDNVRVKEKTMWEVDVEGLTSFRDKLTEGIKGAKETLESVMPPIPKYTTMSFPKKPTKKGKKKGDPDELSASGVAWNEAVSSLDVENDLGDLITKRDEGIPSPISVDTWIEGAGAGVKIKTLNKYSPPNAGSPDQIKSFLFSHGWIPENFERVDDTTAVEEWEANGRFGKRPEQRKIPQISVDLGGGKELCPSVVKLAEDIPEIMAYQKYTTIKHRRDMVKGWLENIVDGKYLMAGCGGFTSTLREQHRILVNIVGVDKLYGKEIRGGLVAGDGNISLGSDLSALEDRVKQHFMLPHDPSYVATMMVDGFCPHIDIGELAGFLTHEEGERYRTNSFIDDEDKKYIVGVRKRAKPVNYGGAYGQQAQGLSISSGLPLSQAKELSKIYYERNWSIEAIAEEQVVIKCSRGLKWLVNPINGLCYALRGEKDRFSALCQGTGSYFFDIWVDNVMTLMYNKWGVKRLNGLFHDELITSFKDTESNRSSMEEIVHGGLEKVNEKFMLRRKLGCDVQFGTDYSQIH